MLRAEMREEAALLGCAGLGGVGGEVRGHGVVEEQVALRHVLAEAALQHAGVDEVFEEGGGSGADSGIGFGKLDEGEPALALRVHLAVASTMAISSGVRPQRA